MFKLKKMLTAHRINTISDLLNIPYEYGIEIDIRDYDNTLVLSHDPYISGENLEEFLKYYNHAFLILNIKSERIEYDVLTLIQKYNITNYFFLDSSFPMIFKLSNDGIKNIALRYSEYESIDSILLMKYKIDWVWVDCFTKFPLSKLDYLLLKNFNFKICIVSPELQNQSNKIDVYKNYMIKNQIYPDMICTKFINFNKWENLINKY